MERYEIGMGDFLKNAGISGLVYLLKIAGAEENVVYGLSLIHISEPTRH